MAESSKPAKPVSKRAPAAAPKAPSAAPKLPPRTAGKKKKSALVKARPDGPERGAPGEPASELLVPALMVVAGLVAFVATSMMVRPEGASTGLWLGIRMTILAVSSVVTYGALFVAAQFVDAEYGYISTGAVKVGAIVLTQAWVGDLLDKIPIPLVGNILVFLVTYAMFKYFFSLDDMAAITSMMVVRLMHFLAFLVVLAAIIGAMSAGIDIAPLIAPEDAAPAEPDPADLNPAMNPGAALDPAAALDPGEDEE